MAVSAASVGLVVALAVFGAARAADAQPSQLEPARTPTETLREGNAAAAAGDWLRVAQLIDPLLGAQLPAPDLAEAHRLAGLAAFFQGQRASAEAQFLAYLRLDLDGQLDPSLYPPDAIIFFNDVKAKHTAELRARRPKARRHWLLNLIPPGGQFQNGERTKGYVLLGLLGGFAIGNATSFWILRSWCTSVSGDAGHSATCDDDGDRVRGASQLRAVNLVSGLGLILTYAYGVYDGVQGYRRRGRELQPFVVARDGAGYVGITGAF